MTVIIKYYVLPLNVKSLNIIHFLRGIIMKQNIFAFLSGKLYYEKNRKHIEIISYDGEDTEVIIPEADCSSKLSFGL